MTAQVQSLLVLMVGVVTLRLSATDAYLNHVKLSMRPWLLISGALLVILAGAMLWQEIRGEQRSRHPQDHEHPEPADAHPSDEHIHPRGEVELHHHDHGGPRVAWLLLLPVLAVFIVPIDPLGAFAAARQGSRPIEVERRFDYPALPAPTRGAVEIPMLDFIDRAFYDEEESLRGVPVRLVGFVAPAPGDSEADFLLTRFLLSCCAADAMPVQIAIKGNQGPAPAVDTWVEVVGVWEPWEGEPDRADWVPNMNARTVTPVEQPSDPYASR